METKDIKLTDDPLTNIYKMVPMLDDEGKKAISHVLLGYCMGEAIKGEKNSLGEQKQSEHE